MTDLNPINPGLNIKKIDLNPKENNKASKEPEPVVNPPVTNFKNADEILEFLNNASISPDVIQKKNKKSIQISKYVNPDQAQRISSAVNNCIKALLSFEEAALNEFGLPKQAAQALAVQSFESQYMPN